jgi:hypothetical protein
MTTPSVLTKMSSNQPVRQAHQNANLEHDYQNDLRPDPPFDEEGAMTWSR